MKVMLRRLYWISTEQFGLDPQKFLRALARVPRYVREYARFRKLTDARIELTPCLHDYTDSAGAAGSEYFLQDLLVARVIAKRNPSTHADIGSRVDGFVAHLASFRDIDVLDIRPINQCIPGINFRQVDMRTVPDGLAGRYASVSCLHTLEHFGLGRYGDSLSVDGLESGIRSLSQLLQTGGDLYISTPVGSPVVRFNANWVFAPSQVQKALESSGCKIISIFKIEHVEGRVTSAEIDIPTFERLVNMRYVLAIIHARKN